MSWLVGLGALVATGAAITFTCRRLGKHAVTLGVGLVAAAILTGSLGGTAICLVSIAQGACGEGCSCTQCYEATNGNEVLLRDPCCKIMLVDPPNGDTPGGGGTTTLFEFVNNDPGCNTAGGLGAARINCPAPTGIFELAPVACQANCDPE